MGIVIPPSAGRQRVQAAIANINAALAELVEAQREQEKAREHAAERAVEELQARAAQNRARAAEPTARVSKTLLREMAGAVASCSHDVARLKGGGDVAGGLIDIANALDEAAGRQLEPTT
jgi:hypothetical protein